MTRVISLILLATVVFLSTLVLRVPLNILQPWFPQVLNRGQQFSGNLAHGAMNNMSAAGQVIDARWSLRPASMLSGKLGVDVNFVVNRSIEGESEVALGLNRSIVLRELESEFDAKELNPLVLPGILRFAGKMRFDIREATLAPGRYGPAAGVVNWLGASISYQSAVSLGDVTLSLTEESGGTRAEIESEGGDILLSGNLRLSPSGDYQTDLIATPAPGASRDILVTLQSVGQPEQGNRFRIRQSGNLSDL